MATRKLVLSSELPNTGVMLELTMLLSADALEAECVQAVTNGDFCVEIYMYIYIYIPYNMMAHRLYLHTVRVDQNPLAGRIYRF